METNITRTMWRDLLIPGSILLAGVAIGLGIFMSNTDGASLAGSGGSLPSATETTAEKVERLANDAGVRTRDLVACVESGHTAELVQEDVDNAIATGGRGTPWNVVIGPTGKTYSLNGALPAAAIQQVLEIVRAEGDFPAELITEGANTDAVAPVTDADWARGASDAAITIVEYSDVDCPFCGRHHATLEQIVAQNDDVQWVYRHFPLDQLHPEARYVSEVSECVGELEGNEAFWNFTDAYFAG